VKLAKATQFIYTICNSALETKRALYIQGIEGHILRLDFVPRESEHINSESVWTYQAKEKI
jgi:hypothetical protein